MVGTWISDEEIFIADAASVGLEDVYVWVNELKLKYLNADDEINDIDDAASSGGIIKLLPNRNLFKPGQELRILIKQ